MPQHAETAHSLPVSPEGAPRFLCDVMLARFCRRLRAAGYDTEDARPGENDRALLARAAAEDRLLLTCDRKIAEHAAAAGRAIVLPSNGLEETARALAHKVALNWFHAPFSRCLVDNEALRRADLEDCRRLPPRVRAVGHDGVFICPSCERLYWPGSHVKRMIGQLNRLQALRPQAVNSRTPAQTL